MTETLILTHHLRKGYLKTKTGRDSVGYWSQGEWEKIPNWRQRISRLTALASGNSEVRKKTRQCKPVFKNNWLQRSQNL
jgi:hypothetical protein